MRPRGVAAACAAIALAAVFSVQQGEHGPLVVYKLQRPGQETPAPAAPVVIPSPTGGAPAAGVPLPALLLPQAAGAVPQGIIVIPSRAPAILGTVVMPAAEPPPAAAAEPGWSDAGSISLQQVSDDILWRRDTAERLPESPFAPRF